MFLNSEIALIFAKLPESILGFLPRELKNSWFE